VFNRIHVEDIARALDFLGERRLAGIFNVTDDLPAPPQDVVEYAASLMKVDLPPAIDFETATISPMARSFYGENKRVSNAKLKRAGFAFAHPRLHDGPVAYVGAGQLDSTGKSEPNWTDRSSGLEGNASPRPRFHPDVPQIGVRQVKIRKFGTAVWPRRQRFACIGNGSGHAQCGGASWYALHSRTASGEMMNPAKMTAAHKTLPFGTKVKVTNADRQIGGGAHQRSRPVHQGPDHRPVEERGRRDRDDHAPAMRPSAFPRWAEQMPRNEPPIRRGSGFRRCGARFVHGLIARSR
jgi:hypothetical protein